MHPYSERENNWLSNPDPAARAPVDSFAIEALARAERSRAIGNGIAAAVRLVARAIKAQWRALSHASKAKPALPAHPLPRAKA